MLKNLRRVNVLRKYFNTKILQNSLCNSVARTGEKKLTEKVTSMEKFRKEMYSRLPCIIKKYGRRRLESRWCAKESPKTLPIDTL